MTSATSCARAAFSSITSATGSMLSAGSRKTARKESPRGVPPGSLVTRTTSPPFLRSSASAAISVDFPAASMPSKVTSTRRSSRSYRDGHRGGRMLNELVRRLGAGKADRRAAERRRKRFPIGWLKDGALVSGLGLEISEKGVLFASRDAPSDVHVDVAIDLGGRRVRARLKVARQGTMSRDGHDWAIIAGVFEGIAADDWDAV